MVEEKKKVKYSINFIYKLMEFSYILLVAIFNLIKLSHKFKIKSNNLSQLFFNNYLKI